MHVKKAAICIVVSMFGIAGCSFQDIANTNNITFQDNSSSKQQSNPGSLGNTHLMNRPNHIVIVVEENHSYTQIAGNPKASYINELMREGTNFTNYHGVEHPSEPNYLSLFSSTDQGVQDDSCPHTFSGMNLASELHSAGFTFGGYSEDLPSIGYKGCSNGLSFWHFQHTYARKHNPWVNFTNVPADENMPYGKFPKDFSQLPTISFVVPNLEHDMHNGSIQDADIWLRKNIGPYKEWANTHASLLIVTWDEDDNSVDNHIPTVIVGPMIRSGTFRNNVNHFNLLRTIEDIYGLHYLGKSAAVKPIQGIWR